MWLDDGELIAWGIFLAVCGAGALLRSAKAKVVAEHGRRRLSIAASLAMMGLGICFLAYRFRFGGAVNYDVRELLTAVSGGLPAALGVLALWVGLFTDPSRGRRRCPACWYDMSGTDGMTCSECGRVAREEREFFR